MNHTLFTWVMAGGTVLGSFFAPQPGNSQPHSPSGAMEHCPRMICPQRYPWYEHPAPSEESLSDDTSIPAAIEDTSQPPPLIDPPGVEAGESSDNTTTNQNTTTPNAPVDETAPVETPVATEADVETTDNAAPATDAPLILKPATNLPIQNEDSPRYEDYQTRSPASEEALNREPEATTDDAGQDWSEGGTETTPMEVAPAEAAPAPAETIPNETDSEMDLGAPSEDAEPLYFLWDGVRARIHQLRHTELGCRLQVRALQAKEQVVEVFDALRLNSVSLTPHVTTEEAHAAEDVGTEESEVVESPVLIRGFSRLLHGLGESLHSAADRLDTWGIRLGQNSDKAEDGSRR